MNNIPIIGPCRERVDRPFRCLDCSYRRELIRVYLPNVDQNCRRFVEERRSKLGRLIEDKARWTRYFTFHLVPFNSSRFQKWDHSALLFLMISEQEVDVITSSFEKTMLC